MENISSIKQKIVLYCFVKQKILNCMEVNHKKTKQTLYSIFIFGVYLKNYLSVI